MTLPIAALDVPLPAVEADAAQCRAAYLLARAAVLLAHPEDAVTRPFVYLKKGTKP